MLIKTGMRSGKDDAIYTKIINISSFFSHTAKLWNYPPTTFFLIIHKTSSLNLMYILHLQTLLITFPVCFPPWFFFFPCNSDARASKINLYTCNICLAFTIHIAMGLKILHACYMCCFAMKIYLSPNIIFCIIIILKQKNFW